MSYTRKKKTKRKNSPLPLILAGMGLILAAVAVMVFGAPKKVPAKTDANVGQVPGAVDYPVPELALTDLNGQSVSLENLRGQVVLVNNWATWCPPCRAEMPELEAYYLAHKNEGFTLVGINAGDEPDQVLEFIREYDLTFPMWLDPTGLALHAFRNNALPSSYVIDQTGRVRMVWTGAVSLEALESYVTPLFED